jgi:amino acid transporter
MIDKLRLIFRAILVVFLLLGILAMTAFIVVVDIIDGVSRDEDSWARTNEPVIQGFQELTSTKVSDGD